MLDGNAVAQRWGSVAIVSIAVSPDHRWLIYGIDHGDERRILILRGLTEESLAGYARDQDRVVAFDAGSTIAWSSDSRQIWHTDLDPSCRPHRVLRRRIDAPDDSVVVVLEERDPAFRLGVRRTRSGARVLIESRSLSSSELRVLDANRPEAEPRLLRSRRAGIREVVAHHPGARSGRSCFFLLTPEHHPDYEVRRIPDPFDQEASATEGGFEEPFLAPRSGRRLESLAAFEGHLVLLSRSATRQRLHVAQLNGAGPPDLDSATVAFPDDLGCIEWLENPVFEAGEIRVGFTSLTVPFTVYDVDLETRRRHRRKRAPMPGGFDPKRYRSRRLWAQSVDGTRVPVTLVERPDRLHNGRGALVLYVYGAYGISLEPVFDPDRLSLLDRGISFALAHVRGGGELGEAWHTAAKGPGRQRGVDDLLACADHLVAEGIARSGRIALMAESAGGFVAGAAITQAPERFRAASLDAPFVDARATLSDPEAPLSATDWDEWGDPRTAEGDRHLRALTPCDNPISGPRPALYVTIAFRDARVAYWEGARWVAKLRDADLHHGETGAAVAPLFLRTTFTGGHWGDADRFVTVRQKAERFAFLVDQLLGDGEDRVESPAEKSDEPTKVPPDPAPGHREREPIGEKK